jgi:hypothetical protein
LLLASAFIFTGCGGSSANFRDYFRFEADTIYFYEATDPQYNWEVFYEYIEGDKAQRRTISQGTSGVEVLHATNNSMNIIFASEGLAFTNYLHDEPDAYYDVLLRNPVEEGAMFRSSNFPNSTHVLIKNTNIRVKVPYGTYRCVETVYSRHSNEGRTTHHTYYAKNVGLVKIVSVYEYADGKETLTMEWSLKDIIKKTGLDRTIHAFYPDGNGGITVTAAPITYRTNVRAEETFMTAVNSFMAEKFDFTFEGEWLQEFERFVDKDDNYRLRAVVNDAFVDAMKTHPDEESEMLALTCIASMIGYMYNLSYVYFSVEGRDYKSDRVEFTVNMPVLVYIEYEGEENDEWETIELR